jgi:hypothetical protein
VPPRQHDVVLHGRDVALEVAVGDVGLLHDAQQALPLGLGELADPLVEDRVADRGDDRVARLLAQQLRDAAVPVEARRRLFRSQSPVLHRAALVPAQVFGPVLSGSCRRHHQADDECPPQTPAGHDHGASEPLVVRAGR